MWADDNLNQNGTGTNGDLHANFRLGKDGEAIGLFAVVGTAVVQVDAVTFGHKPTTSAKAATLTATLNVSFLATPTPRGA